MFFKNKRGEELDEIVKIIIVVVVLVVMIFGIILLFKGKGGSALDAIKHLLHFGQ